MIDNMFKRALAYSIDMLLVSIVVSSIVSSTIINFQLNDYNDLYDEYRQFYDLYLEQSNNDIKTCEELEKAIEDKKLNEEKYVNLFNVLKDNYSKQNLSKEEYDDECSVIVNDYNSNKITGDIYNEKSNDYYYRLEKKSIVGYIVSIIACLLYFVFFQGFTGGQTLGKKINRIKVVSDKDNEKVSYKQLFIRTIFLHSNIYNLLILISILFVPKNNFGLITNIIYLANSILSGILIVTICFSKARSGLHDKIAHTRIVETNFKGIEIKKDDQVKVDNDKIEKKVKTNKKMKRNKE